MQGGRSGVASRELEGAVVDACMQCLTRIRNTDWHDYCRREVGHSPQMSSYCQC